MYGAVSLYSQQLDELSGYLVQLRDKEIAILAETAGSAAHTRLLAEKQTLEEDMSAFIGENIHGNDLQLVSVYDSVNNNSSFMDVLNIHANPSDTNSDLLGMVSSIEVDLMEIFASSHSETTCPHCLAMAASDYDGSNEYDEIGTYTSPDKTATSFNATSDTQVEAL